MACGLHVKSAVVWKGNQIVAPAPFRLSPMPHSHAHMSGLPTSPPGSMLLPKRWAEVLKKAHTMGFKEYVYDHHAKQLIYKILSWSRQEPAGCSQRDSGLWGRSRSVTGGLFTEGSPSRVPEISVKKRRRKGCGVQAVEMMLASGGECGQGC